MSNWRIESFRYVLVGALSNLALYVVYLALTALGMTPRTAMTLLFGVGVATSFVCHKSWTFSYGGSLRRAVPRFALSYGGAYLLNFLLLAVLVGRLGWMHQAVQAGAMGLNAVLLFLLQRHWVFHKDPVGHEV